LKELDFSLSILLLPWKHQDILQNCSKPNRSSGKSTAVREYALASRAPTLTPSRVVQAEDLNSALQSWVQDTAPNIIVAGVALHDMAALMSAEEYRVKMEEAAAKADSLVDQVL
jgi:hypothetical protein